MICIKCRYKVENESGYNSTYKKYNFMIEVEYRNKLIKEILK